MEGQFFMNTELNPTSTVPTWQQLSVAMETQVNELNSSPDCPFKSMDQSLHFDSELSSLVSSPSNCNNNMSKDNSFMIRELIRNLGDVGNYSNSGEISPNSQPMFASISSTNTSCYGTPLNSPPKKLNLPVLMDNHQVHSSVAEFTADPGFAARAARFSCFGSKSFNGRTSNHFLQNNVENFAYNPLLGNSKLPRVASSPSMKAIMAPHKVNMSSSLQDRPELPNSSQESTVSEQVASGETPLEVANESNSRKRKAAPKGKSKEPVNSRKDSETEVENSDSKRSKPNGGNGNENNLVKAEEDAKGNAEEKQSKTNNNAKPPEPPKDYIHVRARRGEATDSHSLAERIRREKISERMKLLQDLVPGCNKVTGKAMMLDEIINYVQSLQRQVEFLSMKLASVNTRLDCNMDVLVSKDIIQSNPTLQQPIFALDSSTSAIFGHQPQQNQALLVHGNISNGTLTKCSMDPLLESGLCRNRNLQLPSVCGFNPQYPAFCEDDLQSIVQMGFSQNLSAEVTLQPQSFNCGNQVSSTKQNEQL